MSSSIEYLDDPYNKFSIETEFSTHTLTKDTNTYKDNNITINKYLIYTTPDNDKIQFYYFSDNTILYINSNKKKRKTFQSFNNNSLLNFIEYTNQKNPNSSNKYTNSIIWLFETGDFYIINLKDLFTESFEIQWNKWLENEEDIINNSNLYSSSNNLNNASKFFNGNKSGMFDFSNLLICTRPERDDDEIIDSNYSYNNFNSNYGNMGNLIRSNYNNNNQYSNNNSNMNNTNNTNTTNTNYSFQNNQIIKHINYFKYVKSNKYNKRNTNKDPSTNISEILYNRKLKLSSQSLIWDDTHPNLLSSNNNNTNDNIINPLLLTTKIPYFLISNKNYILILNLLTYESQKLIKCEGNIIKIHLIKYSNNKYAYEYLIIETENYYQQLVLVDTDRKIHLLEQDESNGNSNSNNNENYSKPYVLTKFSSQSSISVTKEFSSGSSSSSDNNSNNSNNCNIVNFEFEKNIIEVYNIEDLEKELISIDLNDYNNNSNSSNSNSNMYTNNNEANSSSKSINNNNSSNPNNNGIIRAIYVFNRMIIIIEEDFKSINKNTNTNINNTNISNYPIYRFRLLSLNNYNKTNTNIITANTPNTPNNLNTRHNNHNNLANLEWFHKSYTFFNSQNNNSIFYKTINKIKNTKINHIIYSNLNNNLMYLQSNTSIYSIKYTNNTTNTNTNIINMYKDLIIMEFNYANLRKFELYYINLHNGLFLNEVINKFKTYPKFEKYLILNLLYNFSGHSNSNEFDCLSYIKSLMISKCKDLLKLFSDYFQENISEGNNLTYAISMKIIEDFGLHDEDKKRKKSEECDVENNNNVDNNNTEIDYDILEKLIEKINRIFSMSYGSLEKGYRKNNMNMNNTKKSMKITNNSKNDSNHSNSNTKNKCLLSNNSSHFMNTSLDEEELSVVSNTDNNSTSYANNNVNDIFTKFKTINNSYNINNIENSKENESIKYYINEDNTNNNNSYSYSNPIIISIGTNLIDNYITYNSPYQKYYLTVILHTDFIHSIITNNNNSNNTNNSYLNISYNTNTSLDYYYPNNRITSIIILIIKLIISKNDIESMIIIDTIKDSLSLLEINNNNPDKLVILLEFISKINSNILNFDDLYSIILADYTKSEIKCTNSNIPNTDSDNQYIINTIICNSNIRSIYEYIIEEYNAYKEDKVDCIISELNNDEENEDEDEKRIKEKYNRLIEKYS